MAEAREERSMISADELRAAIRGKRLTRDEEFRLLQILAEIAFRLWYEQSDAARAALEGK